MKGGAKSMVLCGELKAPEQKYIKVVYGHYVADEEPDDWGAYQVHCSICGARDVLHTTATRPIQFCYNCAACLLDEEPAEAMTAAEIISDEYGDMIDRDEEESD